MSLARKSSSADEFYDAVESIDEIPSSSRDESLHTNGAGSFLNGSSSLHSVHEAVIVAGDDNEKGSTCSDLGEKLEPESSHSSSSNDDDSPAKRHIKRNSSESNENWVSARCLLDNNGTEHSNNSNEGSNSENWASARCVLENVPSLMDVVSSSISCEEIDRGERRDLQISEDGVLPADDSNCEAEVAAENNQLERIAEDSLDATAQHHSFIEANESSDSEKKGKTDEAEIGDCCSAIDQLNLTQHEQMEWVSAAVADADAHRQIDPKEPSHTQQHHNIEEESAIYNDTQDIILNTEHIQPSKEESSCFDRESANGFLPIDSDSISTNNTRPLTPTQESAHNNTDKKADPQYSTPLPTKKQLQDCSVLDYCDITSPLEALYLMCSNTKRGRNMIKKESMQELLDDADDTSPQRFSSSHDVDPEGVAPMSPENEHVIPESDSDDDSSSAASFSSLKKFRIVDKDTGSVFDVREVMKDIDEVGESTAFDTKYSFLPTKKELQRRTVTNGGLEFGDHDEEDEMRNGPMAADSFDTLSTLSFKESPGTTTSKSYDSTRSTKKKTKLSDLKSSIASKLHKSTLNRKRTTSADTIPRNAIHVKSTSRQHSNRAPATDLHGQHSVSSSFNPMLLVKTIPKAHDGPAWCAAFSLDGRFLATGGEDGNVCIWAVAPKSTAVHPESAASAKEEKKEFDSPVEGDTEGVDQGDIDSPLSMDTGESVGEKVAIDTTPSEEEIPPLNFVGSGPELATNLELLSPEPIQRFTDHTADVIDLSWSHTNFLLTASLDSSVRLYHHSKSQCLHLFKHANLVASVAFHPNDERYFISGGIDKKLRLWSITDGRVKDWAQTPDVITAVRFTPDGRYAVAGLFRGQVYFYDSDGLKYYTQIACRNRSGRYKIGRKVTGISFVRGERDDWKKKVSTPNSEASSSHENSFSKLTEAGSRVVKRMSLPFKGNGAEAEALRYTERMLVSTNDARVRLYGLNDFCLVRKYKGHANYSMQIRARISESGNYIASGSESGHAFLWKTLDKEWMAKHNISTKLHKTKDKAKSPDYFEASKAQLPIVTDTVFFPYRSAKEALLSSQIFPFQLSMDRVDDDLSSAAMLTLDYDGTLRVFLRKSCIDNLLDTATPRGGHLA
ncbi:hypothetical protein ACHAWO_002937 [Cyclotella atomus]|uniref:WD repeat-containing protein 44 n=1 Tax=Cyclotella atomus TaxID=382360 RepID=A0ABD3P0N4_9STRA